MTLLVPIEVPARSGAWELEFQLVHELVTWFSTEGAERLRYPVTVKP
jgi:hypothetical protein